MRLSVYRTGTLSPVPAMGEPNTTPGGPVPVPEDILHKVKSLYASASDQQTALRIYQFLHTVGLMVGPDQLFRSMLILAESDIAFLAHWTADYANRRWDERDVIMDAEDKLGGPQEYGLKPFV